VLAGAGHDGGLGVGIDLTEWDIYELSVA
jgi:hypothetical protein